MGKLAQFKDGLVNLVANLGTPRDKAASTFYGLPMLSDQEADNAYRGTWLARKVIDIPAMDSCRKWRGWSADQEQISAIEAEEKRLGLQQKVLKAMIRARLTGGAALYIGTGQADPKQPLKPESLGKGGIRHINVLSKRVLQAGELDLDPESPGYGLPAFYTLSSGTAGQVRIHPSRLVILQGAEKPDPELGIGDGWGDSVLLAISKAIKDADASAANIASLVFEAKVDVIKIPNFMSSLADPEYEQKVLQRLTLAAMAKGVNGALLLDAEEEYEQKQAQFGGLVDLLMGFMQLTSGASDIPMTRLLGQSPGGLNASGESDLRNYYDRISSNQELVLQPALQVLDECLIRSALGRRPPEVFYNWRSLWQTTDKERADIGKTTADTIKTIADTKLIPEQVLVQVAANMLTEAGVAPGLEAEMLKYGESAPVDGNEQDDDEQRAAASVTASDKRALPVGDGSNFDPNQPRDKDGKWASGAGSNGGEEVGPFGPIFSGYTNRPESAIARLMDEKRGEVPDAFIHPELGPIAFVYGNESMGLRHIEVKRDRAFVDGIPRILREGTVTRDAKGLPRAYVTAGGNPAQEAVIRLDWDGGEKTWLVTAYRKP